MGLFSLAMHHLYLTQRSINMKYKLLAPLFFLLIFFLAAVSTAQAQRIVYDYEDGCTSAGSCVDNFYCVVKDTISSTTEILIIVGKSDQPNCNSSSIGGVRAPGAVRTLNRAAGAGSSGNSIGIVLFISNLLRLFAVVAGIWAMFNMIMGGYTYITSMSDAGATEKVKQSMTMTVIGLSIIAGAYIIAALIGALMFGDPNFILRPELRGALETPATPPAET